MKDRPTPYQVVFAALAEERFPGLREGLRAADRDPRDRDAFVLVKEVVEFLREIGPEDTLGEGVGELVSLTHAGYLSWLDGEAAVSLDRATLDRVVGSPLTVPPQARGRVYYLQLPAQRVWGEAVPGAAPEPLDGWFALPNDGTLGVVAVFGLHRTRDGFTVASAAGPPASRSLARPDGTPLFAARLEGGAAAGLHQVVGAEELVELAWRCHALLPAAGAVPGGQGVTFG